MKRVLLSVIIAAISLLGPAHPIGQAAPRSDGNIYLP